MTTLTIKPASQNTKLNSKSLLMSFGLIMGMGLGACTTTPQHSVELKPGTAWVANAPGWGEEAKQVFSQATSYVQTQSTARDSGTWAVVLDLDETVMNNVAYQVSRETAGLSYTPESWHDWTQKEQATLVPGAAEFVRNVNKLGGHVAFVTNRRDNEQLATENNLASLGLVRGQDFRVLLTRAKPNGKSNKDSRFALVAPLLAAQGYQRVETIAYVGDNKGDKPEQHTEGHMGQKPWQFFCIDQGDMYGDPCAKVPGPGQ